MTYDLGAAKWHSLAPYDGIAPQFDISTDDGHRLGIRASEAAYSCGQWHAQAEGVSAGNVYRFSVQLTKAGPGCRAAALLAWLDGDGVMLSRDYTYITEHETGCALERTVEAPRHARKVRIELFMFCKGQGFCEFSSPSLSDEGLYKPRPVTIATTFIDHSGERTFETNMQAAEQVIRKAAEANPDIIVLTENIYDRGVVGVPLLQKSIPIPGEAYDRLAALAKEYGVYLVFSVHEVEEGLCYNTAVLIDRQGGLAGKYRKVHLTISELEQGIVAGDDFPVFDTDFGKVGILVCWDHWFPEASRMLYLKGAEIICIPTAGFIEHQSRARAAENGAYVVTACVNGPEKSRIIGRLGEVIASVQHDYTAATVDLNKGSYQYWLSVGAAWGEGRSIYINERRPDVYGDLIRFQ